MRLLVTRPALDSEATILALKRLGHEGLAAPLLDIRIHTLRDGAPLDLDGVQALVLTSANGVRAFSMCSDERFIPAYCVGDATAREALARGFDTVKSAKGDVDDLAAMVKADLNPEDGAVLHPAGSRVAGDLAEQLQAAGFAYRREVVYDAVKAETLPEVAVAEIKAQTIDGVVFFSPRTGEAFVHLAEKADIVEALSRLRAYCLSPAVADKINGVQWGDCVVAEHPTQASLLGTLKS